MQNFKVSAIISTYNSEKFIGGRIKNLLQQTISDKIEIIIINSCSEQNEENIVYKFMKSHPNIKYIRTENRETIYKAWNRGVKISRGKYITNANTDDRLRKDAFEILSRALDKNPDKAIVYADQYVTNIPNATFEDIDKRKKFNRLDYSRLRLLYGYIAGPQSMWRASLHFKDNIWFDEKFEVSGDNDFVCRVAEKYDLMRVPGVLGIYYKADDNTNKEFRNYKETHKESFEVREKYLRRYLRSLSPEGIKKIEWQIKLYKKTPHNFWRIVRKLISIIRPEKQMPSREFMFLVASTLEEVRGNNQNAIEFCRAYIDKTVEGLIERQYNRLLAIKGKSNKS